MLEPTQLATLAIFVITIGAIILKLYDEALVALAGASIILILGLTPYHEAFSHYIDWNVIMILLGMWIISYYLVKGGFPELTVRYLMKFAKTYELAVLMIAIGGFMYIIAFSGAEQGPQLISRAKSLFSSVVIGLFIAYGAWLIVNLFFTAIGVAEWTGLKEGWFRIECGP